MSEKDEQQPMTVAEDDGAEGSNATEAQAEAARAQAEARRKRILEAANKRMGVVSGEQAPGQEETEGAAQSARIRAMRQRRYGKKSAGTTTAAASATPEEANVPASSATTTTTTDTETEKEAEGTATKEEPNATEAQEPAEVKQEKTTSTASEEGEGTAEGTTGKKKYLGVAKMRRKLIAKKKLEEETDETDAVSASGVAADVSTAVVIPKVPVVPVYMHILIIVLLFLAGLDVGMQQFHDDVVVHTELAVNEYGIPFVQRKLWEPLTPISEGGNSAKRALEEELFASSSQHNQPKGVDQDEFEEVVVEEVYVPNIDPIFRVDLDELTKEPGFLNQLARGAIAIHRMILWLLYYTPIAMFNTLLSVPKALIKMPPALFLIALVLRQVVGKIILGAKIPEAKPDGADEKNNIEVLSVAKNFVKNFLSTNFPTLVSIYDALVHLRSDMYIVLCGVFCGMAWSHLVPPSGMGAESGLGEEPSVGGGADEL